MGLTKYKLGEFIEPSTANNRDLKYGIDKIAGVCSEGVFTTPKGDPLDVDLHPYKIVENGAFVYTPTRVNIGSIAYRTQGLCIVSHLYIVFYLTYEGKKLIDPIWLYMYLRRKEFGREIDFRLFGSARPEFSYKNMADIDITLPSIEQQRKYVNVYLALQNNLAAYQSKVEELKLVCDGYLDKLKTENEKLKIGEFIEQYDKRNSDNRLKLNNVKGISTEKSFIDTKADMNGVSLTSYKVVETNTFVYVPDTSRRGDKMAIALNRAEEPLLVSSIYTTFKSKDTSKLLPEYLFMFFDRPEERYSRWMI